MLFNQIRSTDISRAIAFAERFHTAGFNPHSESILAVEGHVEDSVDFISILETYDKEKVKIGDKTMTMEEIENRYNDISASLPEVSIYSGNHRAVGYVLLSCFFVLDWDLPISYIKVTEAERLAILANTDHALTRGFKEKERRLQAVRLYQDGKIERESDLLREYGYKKGQAMNAFNTAKLIEDHGIELSEIIDFGQRELSKLAKSDNPKKELAEVGRPEVVKVLSKRDVEDCLSMAGDLAKPMLEAFLSGNLKGFKDAIKVVNGVTVG